MTRNLTFEFRAYSYIFWSDQIEQQLWLVLSCLRRRSKEGEEEGSLWWCGFRVRVWGSRLREKQHSRRRGIFQISPTGKLRITCNFQKHIRVLQEFHHFLNLQLQPSQSLLLDTAP